MAAGGFDGPRKDAWVLGLQAHARMISRLAADLDVAGPIPLGTYDVLVQLSENGGSLRLKDLVDRVLLSQPGLSRKVARLEQDNLVERQPDPSDGRGVLVRITKAGRSALRTASVVHIAGIEREFTSRITVAEATVLARVYSRLLDGMRAVDVAGGDGAPARATPAGRRRR